jgi:ankyrin repeat protein
LLQNSYTVLMDACTKGNVDMVRALINAGANLDIATSVREA